MQNLGDPKGGIQGDHEINIRLIVNHQAVDIESACTSCPIIISPTNFLIIRTTNDVFAKNFFLLQNHHHQKDDKNSTEETEDIVH